MGNKTTRDRNSCDNEFFQITAHLAENDCEDDKEDPNQESLRTKKCKKNEEDKDMLTDAASLDKMQPSSDQMMQPIITRNNSANECCFKAHEEIKESPENSQNQSFTEISIMSIECGDSQQLSQSQILEQHHLFEKSIKNINDSFSNISSYFIRNDSFENVNSFSERTREEKESFQKKLLAQLQEVESQQQLNSQHCKSKICKGNEEIFGKSFGMVQEHLSTNV